MPNNTQARPLVLVVDDNPLILRLVAQVLGTHGVDALTEETGAGAVETYRRRGNEIALVLSDVQMPGLDGPAVLAELRALDPNVRCVFMSGNTGRYSIEQLLALGAEQVLPKPLDSLDQLVEKIRRAPRRGAGTEAPAVVS